MSPMKFWPAVFLPLFYSCAYRVEPVSRAELSPLDPPPASGSMDEPLEVPPAAEAKVEERSLPQRSAPAERPRTSAPSGSQEVEKRRPPLSAESSLIAKITPKTPPQRAASLRLAEEGRKLVEARDYTRALARLEKAMSVDSANPYAYFHLARVHHYLGRYRESLNFLDVAESLFSGQHYWLAEVYALRGENFRALGIPATAGSSYAEALRLNPENPLAMDGMSKINGPNAAR